MGIKDLVAQKAAQAKEFVTGKRAVAQGEERFPEQAHGQLARVQEPNEPSRASDVARKAKEALSRQFSPTFKTAVGYKQPATVKGKKLPDNINKNIPRTRVPVEPQKSSFINRQIDLSYNQGSDYTSNVVNEAFRWKQFENKPQKNITGLPSLRGTFETAVGYQPPKEKKPKAQKLVFVLQRKKK